ncbi:MAG TPA: biopolymer transporter ExbD [Myxococcaceae bacterium]|jgi:biopolymer transport protein ExbD
MAFFYSKRKLRVRERDEGEGLNIVPYLDILMNLIMFMLLSITGLSAFGILNVNAPNYGGPSTQMTDEGDKPKLLLTVLISQKGFYVAATGGVVGQQQGPANPTEAPPSIPRKGDGTYDYTALTESMVNVKKEFPSETKVIVGAEGDIPYETLVSTMDAIRETPGKDRKVLFSDVTLGAM